MIGGMLDRTQRRLGRSPKAARAAALLRNQCDRVIGYHFAPSNHGKQNGEEWLINHLQPATFVDVGANVGEWTAAVLARVPDAQGILVEPGCAAVTTLRQRFGERVRIIAAATGDASGELTFYEEPGAGEHSSALDGIVAGAIERRVPVVTLDSLGLDRVDLLKIDTEGFDARVLRGSRRMLSEHRIGAVQFEYNHPWIVAGDTLAGSVGLLCEAGYETFALRPTGLERFDARRWGEFFSYSNFVALPSR